MSRLQFKGDEYSDDDYIPASTTGRESPEYIAPNHGDSDRSDVDFVPNSYSLFGLERDGRSSTLNAELKSSSTISNEEPYNPSSAASSDTRPDNDGDVAQDEPKSAKKKKRKKKRKREEDTAPQQNSASDAGVAGRNDSGVVVSSFLSKFLGTKREAQDAPEPPAIEPANDSFLKLFQDTFVPSADPLGDDGSVSSSDSDSCMGEHIKRNASNISLATSTNEEEARSANHSSAVFDTNGVNTFALQFFNLPYKITPEQLQAFGRQRGYKFASVVLGVDRKTNLPSGSATVHVEASQAPSDAVVEEGKDEGTLYGDPHNEEVAACIEALHGEEIMGRPIRVQRYLAKKRQSGSIGGRGDARYFTEDISVKCHNCGQVGHRHQDCTNEAVPTPCHLCAGADHEAGNCPNITCYRCGKFGHHSRDCTFPSMARPVICTNCGSLRHDIRSCRDTAVHYKPGFVIPDSKVAGPLVRCMSCNKYGHVMCQPLPAIPAATAEHVYCPNCGENGHHIDFPQLCYPVAAPEGSHNSGQSAKKKQRTTVQKRRLEPTQCMEPKYDAFMKFPQLASQMDLIEPEDRLAFFRQMTRRSSHAEQMLFPPIARQLAAFSGTSSTHSSSANLQHLQNGGGGGGGGGMNRARHSLGPGAGDGGRSVVRYQEGVQRLTQNRYRETEDPRGSAFESVTARYGNGGRGGPGGGGSNGDGYGYAANSYSGRSVQQESGQKRSRPPEPPDSPPPQRGGGGPSRRHSYPQNHHQDRNRQQEQPQNQQQRQPSVLDPAWAQKMESRKRRFHD